MSTSRPADPGRAPTGVRSASGQGELLWFLGTLAIIRVPGEAVDGRLSVIEFLFPRGASPPLHTHPQDESYVVMDGRLTLQAGADRFQLNEGDIAAVPAGVPHTFRVNSHTARVLVLSTPAGIERFVREGSIPATSRTLPPREAERPSPERLAEIFDRHGQITLGPALDESRPTTGERR